MPVAGLLPEALNFIPSGGLKGFRLPKKFGGITQDWESQLPADLTALKTLLEFPHASDNISKMRKRYLAEGPTPDHRRFGWIRTLV